MCAYRLIALRLAGIKVRDEDIPELVGLLREAGFELEAKRLEVEVMILALTIDEREAMLRALDDPPDGLVELRGVLLRERVWRVREGLV